MEEKGERMKEASFYSTTLFKEESTVNHKERNCASFFFPVS